MATATATTTATSTSWADEPFDIKEYDQQYDQLLELYTILKETPGTHKTNPEKLAAKEEYTNTLNAFFPDKLDRDNAASETTKRYEAARNAEKAAAEKAAAEKAAAAKAKASVPSGVTLVSFWTAPDGSKRADVIVNGQKYHCKFYRDGNFNVYDSNQQQIAFGNKRPSETGYVKLQPGSTFKDGTDSTVNWNTKLSQLEVATAAMLNVKIQTLTARASAFVPASKETVFVPIQEPTLAEACGKKSATLPKDSSSSSVWQPVITQAPIAVTLATTAKPNPSERLRILAEQKATLDAAYKAAQEEVEKQLIAEFEAAKALMEAKMAELAKLRQ